MNEFSTAGIQLKYAVEVTKGTRPTSGYTVIEGIKTTPDFNPAPSTIDVTDLSDKQFKRYIDGLQDVSGAQAFTANLTADFKSKWTALVTAYETAKTTGKTVWFEIAIPNFDSFYFAGIPKPLGIGSFSVDTVAEIDAYIVPNSILGWATASTKS